MICTVPAWTTPPSPVSALSSSPHVRHHLLGVTRRVPRQRGPLPQNHHLITVINLYITHWELKQLQIIHDRLRRKRTELKANKSVALNYIILNNIGSNSVNC